MQPSVAKVKISPARKNFLPVVVYAVLLEKLFNENYLFKPVVPCFWDYWQCAARHFFSEQGERDAQTDQSEGS